MSTLRSKSARSKSETPRYAGFSARPIRVGYSRPSFDPYATHAKVRRFPTLADALRFIRRLESWPRGGHPLTTTVERWDPELHTHVPVEVAK